MLRRGVTAQGFPVNGNDLFTCTGGQGGSPFREEGGVEAERRGLDIYILFECGSPRWSVEVGWLLACGVVEMSL